MLQDAVRISHLELTFAKWKETPISNQVLDVEIKFLRNTSRGHYGTQGWIDPKKGMIFILMVQRSGFPNGDASDLRRSLQSIAVAAIKE